MHSVQVPEGRQVLVGNAAGYALILTDSQHCITEWNASAERLFGFRAKDMLGVASASLLSQQERSAAELDKAGTLAQEAAGLDEERWYVRADGSRFRARTVTASLADHHGLPAGFAISIHDLSESEVARKQLDDSVRQRDLLIGELHHRVKNNLQVMMSLFSLQAQRTSEPAALDILSRMQSRIRVFAEIYEQLYTVDSFSAIHFGQFLERLASDRRDLYDPERRTDLQVSVADLALDVDEALSLALIANELLSNAFRHAFPNGRRGRVAVYLRFRKRIEERGGGPRCELEVSDDGAGFTPEFEFPNADSMGLYLVRILTRQLAGSVELKHQEGTSVCVSFPLREEVGD